MRAEETPVAGLLRLPIVRFAIVGASNTAVGYAVFWASLRLPVHLARKASLAQLASYAVGTVWSYFWNRRWTFGSRGAVAREATRFVLLQAGLAATSSLLIGYAVDVLKWQPSATWLGVMVGVTVVNYVLSRLWAFR